MEPANPYSSSESNLELDPPSSTEGELAQRRIRLLAAFIDGLFMLLFMIPGMLYIGWDTFKNPALANSWSIKVTLWICLIPPFLINCYLVSSKSQTLGKSLAGIRMVRLDGSTLTLGRWLTHRTLPFYLVSQIPVVGGFFGLIDALFIFGQEKRCLHDLVADTKVVKV